MLQDRVVIERNVTIVLDVGLLIGGEIATVTVIMGSSVSRILRRGLGCKEINR
jgi:hypothetical protein